MIRTALIMLFLPGCARPPAQEPKMMPREMRISVDGEKLKDALGPLPCPANTMYSPDSCNICGCSLRYLDSSGCNYACRCTSRKCEEPKR